MIHTDGIQTIANAPRRTLPAPIIDRDPGDEHYPPRIPMRCESCDRYCDGQCPLARERTTA